MNDPMPIEPKAWEPGKGDTLDDGRWEDHVDSLYEGAPESLDEESDEPPPEAA